jgi:hypothetical protein
VFNADKHNHKMIMKLDDSYDNISDAVQYIANLTEVAEVYNKLPLYVSGYDYTTVTKADAAAKMHESSVNMLNNAKIKDEKE